MTVSTDTLYTAVAIYHEARSEPSQCQLLVAQVIRNRMDDRGKTAKDVIKERGQFSWTHLIRGKAIETEYQRLKMKGNDSEKKALNDAINISYRVLQPSYNTGNDLMYFHDRSAGKGRYNVRCGRLYFSVNHNRK